MESNENVLSVVSGQTLMELTLPPQDYVIRGLLPMGIGILGGASKIGKSWLMLDLCTRVAKGEPLWDMETRQGTTLYLCLEDTLRRLQNRLDCVTESVPPNAYFATVSGTLADDLEAQILRFIREHPDTVLIVIDTFQMIRGNTGEPSYGGDYEEIQKLKRIADSVNFETGLKLRQDPNTLKLLRMISDDICMAHGFSVLPKYEGGGKKMSAREYRAAQKGQSWKFRLMYDVTDAMKKSQSKEDFIILMKRKGYQVRWEDGRKDITFTCPNGMKCRGSRLHQEKFRKENIENEFRLRKEYFERYRSGSIDPSQWTGHGNPAENPVRDGGLRHPGEMAGGRNGSASAGRKVPADPVQHDRYAGNPSGSSASADRSADGTANGKPGDADLHAPNPATGWEREREIFFRSVRDALRQSQGYGSHHFPAGAEGQKADPHFGGSFYGGIGAGLRGLASAGRLIEDDSEDPDERRKRMEAEQAGSNVGTIPGLAIGAAMALTETKTEEQAIQDEQNFNEFLADLEAEEEEHTWQQAI